MAFRPCNDTFDCISDDGIIRVCYEEVEFSELTSFCDCSTWYGWVGDNCDEVSETLIFNRIVIGTGFTLSVITGLLFARTLLMTLIIEGSRRKLFADYLYLAGIASLFAILCLIIELSLKLSSLFNPTRFEINPDRSFAGNNDIQVLYKNFAIITAAISGLFLSTSLVFLLLLLHWEKGLIKADKFASFIPKNFFRIHLIAYQSILVLGLSVSTILFFQDQFLRVFLVCALSAVLMGIFGFSLGWKIVSLLKFFLKDSKNLVLETSMKTLKLLFRICVGFALTTCANAIYINLNGRSLEGDIFPGTFNFDWLFIELQAYFILCLHITVSWYLNTVSTGAILSDFYPRLCCMFTTWDSRNKSLYPE